jgi:hypothetical protein
VTAVLDNFNDPNDPGQQVLEAHLTDTGESYIGLGGTDGARTSGNGFLIPHGTGSELIYLLSKVFASSDFFLTLDEGAYTVIGDIAIEIYIACVTDGTLAGTSGYRIQYHAPAGGFAAYKFTNGAISGGALGTSATPWTTGVKVAHSGDTTSIYIDGNSSPLFSFNDPTYHGTRACIGWYSGSTGDQKFGRLQADVLSAPPTTPDPPALVKGSLLSNGDAQVAWEPSVGATSYEVWKASASGGTFTLLHGGIVLTWDVDAAHASGNAYKIKAVNSSGASGFSAEILPKPYIDWGLSGGRLLDAPPQHDVLAPGPHLAHWSNLHYTLKTEQTLPFGPTSEAYILDERFDYGLFPQLTKLAGTEIRYGDGVVVVDSAANQWTGYKHDAHLQAPIVTLQADWLQFQNKFLLGLGPDASGANGLYLRGDAVAGTLDLFGVTGGVETSIIAPFSAAITPFFRVALEITNCVFMIYLDAGDGWGNPPAGSGFVASGSAYDLRNSALMSAWFPMFLAGKDTGTTRQSLSRFVVKGFGGCGRVREAAAVTHLDGTPALLDNGNTFLILDRTGPNPSGLADDVLTVNAAGHEYDPQSGLVIGGPLVDFTMTDRNGTPIGVQELEVRWEDGVGFHCMPVDWSNWSTGSFPNDPRFYYQLIPGSEMRGRVHFGSAVQVTLPAGILNTAYGPTMRRANGNYVVAFTQLNGSGQPELVVASGSTPSNLPNLLLHDVVRKSEGTTWLHLGTSLYLLAGAWNVNSGKIYVYDFSDLAAPTYEGMLDYPVTSMGLAQQPDIAYAMKGGLSVPQLLGFRDVAYNSADNMGPQRVWTPSYGVQTWQFPVRRRLIMPSVPPPAQIAAAIWDPTFSPTRTLTG